GPTAPRPAADAGLLPPAGPVPAPLAVAALWLGLVAAVALAAVLAAASSRRLATGGLLTVLAGTVVLLPLSAVPADAPAYGTTAGRLVLAGATLHTAGWVLLGWAVARCRLLDRGDGVLLMMAAPMIGVAGHLIGPLQTVGALLLLAGGMGVARRAGRLAPPDRYRLDPFAPPIMD
ncbi:MAG TPA: hypothetical protein VES42_07850, partial [Pilimelia sp.]|nr:hypothetical protein [Pilimelia sp.]